MAKRPADNDPEMSEEDKLSVREAAEAISVTRGTLQSYITSGRINTNPDGTINAAELYRAGFIIRTLPPRLQSLYVQYQQPQQTEQERQHLSQHTGGPAGTSGSMNMLIGGLFCIGGILVTGITYSMATSSPAGGTYIIAWGAIVFGAIRFFKGVSQSPH